MSRTIYQLEIKRNVLDDMLCLFIVEQECGVQLREIFESEETITYRLTNKNRFECIKRRLKREGIPFQEKIIKQTEGN